MSAKRFLLGCLGLLVFVGSLRADPPLPLDLIPEDACIGVAARNLAELRTKSDRLLGKQPNAPRPSQLLDMVFNNLNLAWKIDQKKPSALVCMTGVLGGHKADADPNQEYTIGTVLTPQSLDEVARSYKVKPEELTKGQVFTVAGREDERNLGTTQVAVRDGLVFLTGNRKSTEAWAEAKKLRQTLPAARQRRLDAADGLVYFGPPLLKLAMRDMDPTAVPPELGATEAEAQVRLNRAYQEVRYVLAGYRVDDGIALDLGVGFDPKGGHSQAVLKAVTGAGRTSNLKGLPDSDRLVGAFAAIGLNRADLPLARVLVSDLWFGLKGSSPLLESDALLLRRIFGDLYSRLRLGRVAVYHSSDPARFGQLAAVAVLEPDDADQFVREIMQYARLGDVEQFDPKGEASKAEIEKLIGELGAEEFATRESASTKLGLIGTAALPYLEKAEKADDAEVRRRAADLGQAIRAATDLRKKELREGLLQKAFRPNFSLKRDAEKRAEVSVHWLGMRFDAEDASYAGALKDLFGPDYRRLRLAVVNKQVVIFLGSDLDLLDETLRNVRDDKAGLEQSTALAEFRKQAAAERRMELHLALSRVRALVTPKEELPKEFKPTAACSSIALRTGPSDLGLDLWVPAVSVPDALDWLRIR